MDEGDQYDIEYNKVCVENEHPCKNSAENATNILWIKGINNYVVAIIKTLYYVASKKFKRNWTVLTARNIEEMRSLDHINCVLYHI